MKCFKALQIFFLLLFSVSYVFADEPASNRDILEELKAIKSRVEVLEHKVAAQEELIRSQQNKIIQQQAIINQQEDQLVAYSGKVDDICGSMGQYSSQEGLGMAGLNINAGATFIFQGSHNANAISGDRDENASSYSVDLTVEKNFSDFGKGFIHLEAGDGDSVENELSVFSNVNRDAGDSDSRVDITEAYYEHYFKGSPFALTVGKIDATSWIDTNEYANCECTQFLGHIFRNSPVVEFPSDNGAGFRIGFLPFDTIETDFVLMDGDADWDNMFDNLFFANQVNFRLKFFGKEGNYRFIYWVNQRDHTKWLDQNETDHDNWGLGLSCDQQLTDTLGIFLRYGWQNSDVFLSGEDYSLEHAWSVGLNISGSIWGRKDDSLGLAFGYAIPSEKYKDYYSNGIGGADRNCRDEGHFEAYYNYQLNDHLAISPDVQLIWNPYGKDASGGDNTITVLGMRGQVDF